MRYLLEIIFAPFRKNLHEGTDGLVKIKPLSVWDYLKWEQKGSVSWWIFTKDTDWYIASNGSQLHNRICCSDERDVRLDCEIIAEEL